MDAKKSVYLENPRGAQPLNSLMQEVPMPAQYILLSADIISVDEQDHRWEALAVKDGRVFRVGSNQEMNDLAGEGWPVYHMAGQTILPGFIDCHSHLEYTGAVMTCRDGRNFISLGEILGDLRQAAAVTPPGKRIVMVGVKEPNLQEGRGPNRRELDSVTTDHPVAILEYTWHQVFLNSRALEKWGVTSAAPGVDMDETGAMTGVLRDPLAAKLSVELLSDVPEEDIAQGIVRSAWLALSRGFTTLHSMQGGKKPGGTERVRQLQDQIPVHLILWEQSADIDAILRLGLTRFGGCGDLQADGEIGSYTAALFEPYSNRLDCRGVLNYSQEYWDEVLQAAERHRLQFTAHAEGEAGIEAVLWAIEKAQADSGRQDSRHRIEHLELPTMNQLARMAQAGVIASVQPSFLDMNDAELAEFQKMYGPRIVRLNPLKTIWEQGVVLVGGSDSPVTECDPLIGIHWAMNHPREEERLPLTAAIKMFTINAAYSGFEEQIKGSLEPGKMADMVVLSVDPYTVPPAKFRESVRVREVFVAGKRYALQK